RHRLEAQGIELSQRPLGGLVEMQEPGLRSGEARGGGGLGPVTLTLQRARASRPSGVWKDEDYDVRADGKVIGRIYERGRRRHQPRRPPLAKTKPGSPAPAMGPGTADAGVIVKPPSTNNRRSTLQAIFDAPATKLAEHPPDHPAVRVSSVSVGIL